MNLINLDLSLMAEALLGTGINAKPKALHKIGVSRRKTQIKGKVKEIEEGLTPHEDYKKFFTELEELKKKYADKDKDGKMVEMDVPSRDGQKVKVPVIEERLDDYMKALDRLRKKFAEPIADAKALNASYDEVLMAKCELKLAPVIMSDFVKEKTTYKELFGLYPIIKDFDKEKMLKKKTTVEFSVAELIGESDRDDSGLADVNKMIAFNPINDWDLSVILAYNMRTIRTKAFELKASKAYKEHKEKHEDARIELCEVYAKKNINGDAMQNQMGYVLEDVPSFNADFDKLKVKNKKIIDAYEKFLESKVELQLIVIPEDVLNNIDKLLEEEELELTPLQAEILDSFI